MSNNKRSILRLSAILIWILALCIGTISPLHAYTDGSIDTAFMTNVGTGFNNYVRPIALQSDGKILAGGHFTSYNGTSTNRIIRLNANGTMDETFNTGGAGFNSFLRWIEVQPDGKILVGGSFTTFNGVASNRLIRLYSDGTRDNDFVVGTSIAGGVTSLITMARQTDGKVLIGGVFTTYNGSSSPYIARLGTDGSIDPSFSIGTGFNGRVNSIQVLSDGDILVGGEFTSYNGTSINRIIRLNSDGTIDLSLDVGTGFNGSVYVIRPQSDGTLIVGGLFTTYKGTTANKIIKLSGTGEIDGSFTSGTGFDADIEDLEIQADGKIIAGGIFTSYNGTSVGKIVRLNSDGTIDSSFNIGTGFDNTVLNPSITIDSNNDVLVGGLFTTYNGISANRIVRLTYVAPNTPSAPVLDSASDTGTSSSDRITNDTTPTFTGTASSSAIIYLYKSSTLVGTTTSDGSGNYSITVSPAITPDGSYDFAVIQSISGNLSATSSAISVLFDSSAPILSSIASTTASTTASITWTTNETATSTLQYGLSTSYGSTTAIDTASTSNSISLSNLTPNTLYYFRIIATDSLQNSTTTGDYTFTTTAASGGSGGSESSSNSSLIVTAGRTAGGGGYVPFFISKSPALTEKNPDNLCTAYIKSNIKYRQLNSSEDVTRLQNFLNTYEEGRLPLTGIYDLATKNAVDIFQAKYAKHILFPWGITKPTGAVLQTTRAKINAMVCAKTYGCPYFNEYHKVGESSTDIKRVKSFLNLLNSNVSLNTSSPIYDQQTKGQITAFQSRYRDTVLKPWGLSSPTSYWYKTTRGSAHEIMGCTEQI
ncbi:MAG: Delta-60 repeat protein/Por secretion system C-terminal sorting [Patescibacteria group bacterium]|nr:Delta-60 repeat protein/Por secretion system C-terminal sorting [Patescibacteria group bacterium]